MPTGATLARDDGLECSSFDCFTDERDGRCIGACCSTSAGREGRVFTAQWNYSAPLMAPRKSISDPSYYLAIVSALTKQHCHSLTSA
jgi:hypothetical protein